MKRKEYRKRLAKQAEVKREYNFAEWAKAHGLKTIRSNEEVAADLAQCSFTGGDWNEHSGPYSRTFIQKIKHFVLRPIAKWLYLSK